MGDKLRCDVRLRVGHAARPGRPSAGRSRGSSLPGPRLPTKAAPPEDLREPDPTERPRATNSSTVLQARPHPAAAWWTPAGTTDTDATAGGSSTPSFHAGNLLLADPVRGSMIKNSFPSLALLGVTLVLGCSESERVAPSGAGADSIQSILDATTLRASSSGGTAVTLALPDGPVQSGPVKLVFEVDRSGAAPISVDLVSPTMPIHGVVRSPVEPMGAGRYGSTVDVPMEGRWAVYVNLDETGLDAAQFAFDVGPESDGSHPLDHAPGHDPRTGPPHGHGGGL